MTRWTSALLLGNAPAWPLPEDPDTQERAMAFLQGHGIAALCYAQLARTSAALVPREVTERLKRIAYQQAATTMLQTQADRLVLARLHDAGLSPLVLKGAAVAHTLYEAPYLRPRTDTDLLFPDRKAAERALTVLEQHGYTTQHDVVDGALISTQRIAAHRSRAGPAHALDIHWAISNTQTFSRALPWEALDPEAYPLPQLHPEARTLAPHHSLLLACLHLFGETHINKVSRLIWLHDIHSLAERLDTSGWHRLIDESSHGQVAAVCLWGLRQAHAWLTTTWPEPVETTLTQAAQTERFRPERIRSSLQYQWYDLYALPRWQDRLRYLRETTLPSADYMRHKYAGATITWLPWLYLRRSVCGIYARWVGSK